jgi:hypothetical protein
MIRDNNNNIINEFISTKDIGSAKGMNHVLDYKEYSKKSITLTAYKIPELKQIAKRHRLHVTGTKPILVERIKNFFYKTKCVIKIQTCFRKWIVQVSMKLRGPALKNRSICVNDVDFVTMQPICEIPTQSFYSYSDSNNFTYGFDIASIVQALKKTHKLENPYNREKIHSGIVANFKKLHRICCILFPDSEKDGEGEGEGEGEDQNNGQGHNENRRRDQAAFRNVNYTEEQQIRILNMVANRQNPLSQRVTNLFLEFDQLGNYTSLVWFNSLSTNSYIQLYRCLYDIWHFRSQFSRETRYNICPFTTPFSQTASMIIEIDQVKTACIEVFENLVFTGRDDEHRKLGAFQALTALTMVSYGAREAMPWLYESVVAV